MAVWIRGLVALQLVGLLLSSLSPHVKGVNDEEKQRLISAHPPAPAKAPTPSPLPSPPPPVGLSVAVEGVVYCRSCKLPGYDTSLNASPLRGAVAKLLCNDSKHGVSVNGNATTDAKGYFLIQVHKIKPSTLSMCKVVLTLPVWCNKPIYPKARRTVVPLKFERIKRIGSSQCALYTAGFFEFAPVRTGLCRRLP